MNAHKVDPLLTALQFAHTDIAPVQVTKKGAVSLKDRAIDLWQDGADTLDIAHALGVAECWVSRIINRWRSEQIEAGTRGAVE
ncbi:helix-turn-helix domain-containing protein [Xanthobacter versatilis]|uniref:helix-turn-helix domain-containing protein n=1 Tax=Xanthobacter autotrophicus (strain ATCC BAA-1158 / Py2) TaxID=78245 RepID=UPI0037294FBA